MNEYKIKNIVSIAATGLVTAGVVFSLTSSYYINNYAKENTQSYNKTFTNQNTYNFSSDDEFAKLKKIYGIIQKEYLSSGEIDMEKFEEGAIYGALESLGDPYTSYFNKSDTEDFLTDTEGIYEGVGMYITYGTGIKWPMVLSTFKDSPANLAGVLPGDFIYMIDGVKMEPPITLEEVSHKLKGVAGSKVNVTFVRVDEDDNEEVIEKELIRKKIEIFPLEYEVKDGNIGYIKFTSFDEGIDVKFFKAYNDLVQNKKVKGLIIDIRDNSGGLLAAVESIADRLIPKGIITYTVDKNGNKEVAMSDERQTDVPIVVIQNGNSASASEILAGAIKDSGVGKVVGEPSFGKGLVQSFKPLHDGTYIKVTVAEYFSPNGNKINNIGVIPDYEIVNDKNTTKDEQLNKALEILR